MEQFMLTLTDKIGIRAQTLWILFDVFRPSMWIIVSMGISVFKFYSYGLGMYEGRAFPKMMTLHQMLQIFIDSSITPLLWWVPVTMIVERVAIRPMFYKYIVSRAKD